MTQPTSSTAPLKSPPCPRCRAAGRDDRMQPTADAFLCLSCGSTWVRGRLGQMVAR